jgi:hypothetical protein
VDLVRAHALKRERSRDSFEGVALNDLKRSLGLEPHQEPNHEPYVFEPCEGSWKVRQVVC